MAEHLSIDVFWSFRSPWSYLATPRLVDWAARYDLDVVFRPVYPIAIRTPEFFNAVHPLWFPYFMTDVHRVAQFLELPFQWPRPDPVAQEFGAGRPTTAKIPAVYPSPDAIGRPRAGARPRHSVRTKRRADDLGRHRGVAYAVIIWRTQRRRLISISPIWTARSNATSTASRRSSNRIRSIMKRPAIGACRRVRFAVSRFLARTGSMCCCGD